MADITNVEIQAARAAFIAATKAKAAKRKAEREAKAALEAARQPSRKALKQRAPSFVSAMPEGVTLKAGEPRLANGHKAPKTPDRVPGYGEPPPASLLGRPCVWTPENKALWQRAILLWIAEGRSLVSFVKEYPQGPTLSTVYDWRSEPDVPGPNGEPSFSSMYLRAREDGADSIADELLDIADGVKDAGRDDSAKVNAARLRVDARKWSASKLKPRTYADRVEQSLTVSGQVNVNHSDQDRALALAAFMQRHAIANADSLPDAIAAISRAPVLELKANATAPDENSPADQDSPKD